MMERRTVAVQTYRQLFRKTLMIVLKKVVYTAQWQIKSAGLGILLLIQHPPPLSSPKKRIKRIFNSAY
jgi:hypothetical protein